MPGLRIKPVRILHVVPSYIPAWRYGGPIHSVHGLCKALAARGHHVEVATTNVDGDSNSDVPLDRPASLDGVIVNYFPSTRLRRLYYSPPMHRFLSRRSGDWDVIHTHSVFLWPTTAAAHVARRSGTPYVLSPRGMLVKDLIARRSTFLKRSWIALFERRNVERADAIHVTSAIEGKDLLALGLHPRHVFEVPNGFDVPEGPGVADPLPGMPERYALFLGRISWKKGIDRLLKALAHAPALHVVIAGNDDEGYWPKMQQLARELSIESRVHYAGFVEGARKHTLISGALFMVLPSHSENFGNAVLESMALGVPVVVTPEVGLSTVVESTGSGLVAAGDAAPLGAALSLLAGDEALRGRLGQNARRAAAGYSWDGVAEKFEGEYRGIVAKRHV